MDILTGVYLDVSKSVRENFVGGELQEGTFARSIFEILDNFVNHDVSSDFQIFAVGVGAKYGEGVFDVIKTIEPFKAIGIQADNLAYDDVLEEFYRMVEKHNACTAKKWAPADVIKRAISYEMASLLVTAFRNDDKFLKEFVDECLPLACKGLGNTIGVDSNSIANSVINFVQEKMVETTIQIIPFVSAGEEEIKQIAGRLFKDVITVYPAKRVSEILRGCIGEDTPTKQRMEELMEVLKPYIYGETSKNKAFTKMIDIFSKDEYSNHKKLLFVFSDGEPTSQSSKNTRGELHLSQTVLNKMKDLNVTVVGCLFNRCQIQPQKLFSIENQTWNNGAKFLFRLSSSLSSQLLPRTVLLKNGWEIETTNNETKLFFQISNPVNISNACKLAKNLVCCQDSLADLLASVSLDMYINQSAFKFTPEKQIGSTCYANAIAAVYHLSMKRIIGRTDGYPSFDDLRRRLIDLFGIEGAYTEQVLAKTARNYRLQFKPVNINQAMQAVVAKRPVVATFSLTDDEWAAFSRFFRSNPEKILTERQINIGIRVPNEERKGHAVVLTSFNSECLHFMNSWGKKWADGGFFRVQNANILGFKFYDVYWTLNDLEDREKAAFRAEGPAVAAELVNRLTRLRVAEYKCPICNGTSLVTEYEKCLRKAKCPKCKCKFDFSIGDEAANMLVINMYLTSLYDS